MFCSLFKKLTTAVCIHQWHNTKISRTEEVRRCRECDKLQLCDSLKSPKFRNCTETEYFKLLSKARCFKNVAA